MKILESIDCFRAVEIAVRQKGRPAVYISNGLDLGNPEDLTIWNNLMGVLMPKYGSDALNIIFDDVFFFATQEEARGFFNVFKEQPFCASALLACLFDENGVYLTENSV